ncbi:adhesion G protein-coupled receptor L1-like isoform X2 [Macrobrachium nipponense]|uniref:adhesion G protein-coupled receptor L1-like isoform X2 n=1 Tax=Macrobrachium nipponense TaxID=159736 RepID=UPI0030C84BBC
MVVLKGAMLPPGLQAAILLTFLFLMAAPASAKHLMKNNGSVTHPEDFAFHEISDGNGSENMQTMLNWLGKASARHGRMRRQANTGLNYTSPPTLSYDDDDYVTEGSGYVTGCPAGEWRCLNGQCIPSAYLCDGRQDCSDHSDETVDCPPQGVYHVRIHILYPYPKSNLTADASREKLRLAKWLLDGLREFSSRFEWASSYTVLNLTPSGDNGTTALVEVKSTSVFDVTGDFESEILSVLKTGTLDRLNVNDQNFTLIKSYASDLSPECEYGPDLCDSEGCVLLCDGFAQCPGAADESECDVPDELMPCDEEGMSRCPVGEGCAHFCDGVQECELDSDENPDNCSMNSFSWKFCGYSMDRYRCPDGETCANLCNNYTECGDSSDETEEVCSFLNSVRCPKEIRTVLNQTYSLSATPPGGFTYVQCPNHSLPTELSGIWKCGWDSVWAEMPDFSNCRTQWNFFLASNETHPSRAADNLTAASVAIKDKFLLPGDILAIVRELKSLYERHADLDIFEEGKNALNLSERYVTALVSVSTVLLDQLESWRLMRQEDVRFSSSALQESIVKAALAEARLLTSDAVRKYPAANVDLQIVSQHKDYFGKRENRLYKNEFSEEDQLLLPEEFYENYEQPKDLGLENSPGLNEDGERIVVVFNSFRNLHCLTNNVPCDPPNEEVPDLTATHLVNSRIIGATVGFGRRWQADKNDFVELKFSHIYDGFTYELANVRCKWWNTEIHYWSSKGCTLKSTNEKYSICRCDHLTNLAVIMDVRGLLKRNHKLWKALEWITVIGCSISIICLAIGIVCFALLKIARDKKKSTVGALKYLIRLNLCICLILAELILLTGLNATKNKILCALVAALLHYFFIAVFAWCAIEAFNLYLALMKVFNSEISQKHYVLAGYGLPLVMVAGTLAITQANGYGSKHVCWLAPNGLIWSFAGTIAFIITANIVAFVMVMRVVWNEQTVGATGKTDKSKLRRFIGSVSIFLTLGLTWITGFLYVTEASVGLAVAFTLLNSLQGAFIIIFGIFLEENVRLELLQIFMEKTERLRALIDNHATSTAENTVTTSTGNGQPTNSSSTANQIVT